MILIYHNNNKMNDSSRQYQNQFIHILQYQTQQRQSRFLLLHRKKRTLLLLKQLRRRLLQLIYQEKVLSNISILRLEIDLHECSEKNIIYFLSMQIFISCPYLKGNADLDNFKTEVYRGSMIPLNTHQPCAKTYLNVLACGIRNVTSKSLSYCVPEVK